MESIYLIAHVMIIVLILVNAVMTTMTTALSKFFFLFSLYRPLHMVHGMMLGHCCMLCYLGQVKLAMQDFLTGCVNYDGLIQCEIFPSIILMWTSLNTKQLKV